MCRRRIVVSAPQGQKQKCMGGGWCRNYGYCPHTATTVGPRQSRGAGPTGRFVLAGYCDARVAPSQGYRQSSRGAALCDDGVCCVIVCVRLFGDQGLLDG